ncbi:uncharacterized protein LOC106060709 [Biomphalaria glabrata]|uniref:Uncharacterized protein LOC106060709 n=1 Tax=Biomphalaria glabrata TaxID=6526 RepID=A0A9W3BI60_BIOGL|nr:uncharacterized protein LOC106060709 [Biomphalaria glabrata]
MEALIRSQNFAHDDERAWITFQTSVDDLPDNQIDERGMHDVIQSLEALADKLTADSKPSPKTKGWQMAHYALEKIIYIVCRLKRPSNEMPKIFYEFMIRLLDNSLTALHLTLAEECLEKGYLKQKEYIQTFDKAKLEALLKVVFKPIKPEEIQTFSDYGNVYYKFLNKFLKEELTDSQVKDVNSQLLDYAVYCFLDSIHLNERVYQKLVDTGQTVMSLLNNPFSTFSDYDRIRAYIKKCIDVFHSESFAPNKTVSRFTLEFMERKMMKDLGKQGKLEEVYNELFDLLMTISKCTYTLEGDKYLFDLFYGAQVYFSNFEIKSPKVTAEVFENIVQRFIKVVEEMDMKFLNHYRFAYSVVDALNKVYANDKQKSRSWVSMLIPLFKRSCQSTIRACYTITSENKAVKWKEHVDIVSPVLQIFLAFQPPPSVKDKEKKEKDEIKEYLDYFKRTAEYFFDGLKKDKLTKSYGKEMMDLSLKFMNTEHEELYNLAESIAEKTELNIKEDKNAMIDAVKRFHELLKKESLPWAFYWPLYRAAVDFIDKATEPFKDGKLFKNEDFEVFVSLCLTCLQYDCLNPETGSFPSGHFSMFLSIVKPLFRWLEALNKMDLAAPLVPELIKCLNVDDENVINLIGVYIMIYGRVSSGQNVAAPYLENLIVAYLEKGNQNLLTAITQIYPSNPRAFKSHYQDFIQMMDDTGEPILITYLSQLFQLVSKKQAELFASKDIEMLFNKAQEHENSQILIIQILQELTKRCPEKVIDHLDILFDKSSWAQHSHYFLNDMMVTLAFYSKEAAAKVFADIFSNIKINTDKTFLLVAFNSVRMIGFKYQDLLKERRKELEDFQTTDPDIIQQKKFLLDMIDGKTPEDMTKQLKKQEEELASLVGRVDETEEILNEVKVDVSKQKEQLDNVNNEVKEQGQKLTNVETKMDETVVKVEEIDKKTLSHAPYWARDISKLLNPKSEHDWRLLSSRLGYNNEDIRGWAQQADPCMALLNEWYTTHKTSEATLAVLTQLQEMDRLDAAAIVENAMKNAEAVVEDEEFVYPSPPPIFISYQWSHQAEVKLLKQHLEMAGYECWLDIGQMGGGDKLFKKIDTGIRAAKVVISCVTSNYAKSPNCNREVNLSVSLNKPIIPLLLEQCPWPPPGSMGPIFSEYLFIRFFQRTGEEMSDQRYWAKDKFQELLMQLNVVGVPPDETKVQPEYKKWWIPVVQEITIDKSKTKNGGTVAEVVQSDLDKIASDSPDIFISYQWGKQKNIIKLYERLTSLGFSCWLDIKQMGGGDSLYDKIDRGIRGCKVVLSCVTQKYSLSANCRREVSLTDALKKPMIPLLLEKMTWPPSGPMSMVMTQLVYINFSKDESIQMTWDGPEFNDLLNQIKQHIPNKVTPMTSTEVAKSTSSIVSPSTKTTQNTLKPASPLQKPERKNSHPTKPSLVTLKAQPKSNQIQKLPSPVASPPSTASSLSKQDSVKKSDPSVRAPLTKPLIKPLPSSKPLKSNRPPKAEQNDTSKNIALITRPTSKTILKPISADAKPATQPAKQIAPFKPPDKAKPATNIQQRPGRPSRLPPIEQQNSAKTSLATVKKV